MYNIMGSSLAQHGYWLKRGYEYIRLKNTLCWVYNFVVFLIPLFIITSWGGGQNFSSYIGHSIPLLFIYLFAILCLIANSIGRFDYIDTLLVLGAGWIFLTAIYRIEDLSSVTSSINAISTLIAFYWFPKAFSLYGHGRRLFSFLLLLGLIPVLYSIAGLIANLFGVADFSLFYKNSFIFQSVFPNPNGFGILSMTGAISVYFLAKSYRNKGFWLLFFTNFLLLIASFARGAILPFLLLIFLYEAFLEPKRSKGKKILLSALGVLLAVIVFSLLTNVTGPKNTLTKTLQTRSAIWVQALNIVKENPLWGYGDTAVRASFEVNNKAVRAAHNSFIDRSLRYGILPVLCFVFWFAVQFLIIGWHVLTGPRQERIWAILWMGIGALFLQAFVRTTFIFSSGLGVGVVPFYLLLSVLSAKRLGPCLTRL